jgi:hypothetical protein
VGDKRQPCKQQEIYVNGNHTERSKGDTINWISHMDQGIKKDVGDDLDHKVTLFARALDNRYCAAKVYCHLQCFKGQVPDPKQAALKLPTSKNTVRPIKKGYQTTKPNKVAKASDYYLNLPIQSHAAKKSPSAFWLYGPVSALADAEDDRLIGIIGRYRKAWDMEPKDLRSALLNLSRIAQSGGSSKTLSRVSQRHYNKLMHLNRHQLDYISSVYEK